MLSQEQKTVIVEHAKQLDRGNPSEVKVRLGDLTALPGLGGRSYDVSEFLMSREFLFLSDLDLVTRPTPNQQSLLNSEFVFRNSLRSPSTGAE
jgi:hypothetical protein